MWPSNIVRTIWLIMCVALFSQTRAVLKCGERKVKSAKTWNGVPPWQAAIYYWDGGGLKYYCGGTIISIDTVLTAASCIHTKSGLKSKHKIAVHIGRNELNNTMNGIQQHKVLEVIPHPNFRINSWSDNIALIRLADRITMTNEIQDVRIWNIDATLESIIRKKSLILGFTEMDHVTFSDQLQKLRVEIVDFETCWKSDRQAYGAILKSNMYCGKIHSKVCVYTEGHGLIIEYEGILYVRGISSVTPQNSYGCDTSKYTIFTDVAKYIQWISQYVVPETLPMAEQWPWHAVVFVKDKFSQGRFVYKCEGSIVDSSTILTVAHCLYSNKHLYSPDQIQVHLGFSDLNKINDRRQVHYASMLIPHPNYTISYVADDIALIKLATDITMTLLVQPVCLWDMDNGFEWIVQQRGTVISFGETEHQYYEGKLKETRAEIVHWEKCLQRDTEVYLPFLEPSMICAKPNVGICRGSAGSELLFYRDGNWFVRGIVSFTIRDNNGNCDFSKYTIFTDVAKYRDWIAQHVVSTIPSNRRTQSESIVIPPLYDPNRRECGQRKVPFKFLIYNAPEAKEHHWPWHAAIYYNLNGTFTYGCGGSIIDSNTILTVAHCVYSQHGLISKNQIQVHLGHNELNSNNQRIQVHGVSKLIPHPKFTGFVTDDIALIKLDSNITLTYFTQAVCLWDESDGMEWITKNNGTLVGFGETEKRSLSKYLREASINVIDAWECIDSNRDLYGKVLTSNMFCGKANGNVSACSGDSGGGLVFEKAGSWFVRGLVSFIPGDSTTSCDVTAYTGFTDVAKYRNWIEQYVEPTNPSNVNSWFIDSHPNLRYLNQDECGITPQTDGNYNNDIVYPWIGLIELELSKDNFFILCQVTLINEWYAVAPAQCYTNETKMHILLGHYAPRQRVKIETFTVHPRRDKTYFINDIQLIELHEPADITRPDIAPICLPITAELRKAQNNSLVVASFERNKRSVVVKATSFVNHSVCETQYSDTVLEFSITIDDALFCTQLLDRSRQECMPGASVQSLQTYDEQERYFLRGFVLFGLKPKASIPTVNIDVEKYLPWILSNLKDKWI